MKTFNYVSNFYAIPGNKYGKAYLAHALKILADKYGTNQQYLICQLMLEGLKHHPQYSREKAEIDALWEKVAANLQAEAAGEAKK